MLQNFSFLYGFFSKLLYKLLPAAIASVIGAMLISHYARTSVVTPAAAVATPASAEMMQLVRDDHQLIVKYLKKENETCQQSDRAAEQDMLRSKAAEQAAMLAASEAIAAESRALAIAAHAAAKPERKVAAKPPAHNSKKIVAAAPLQLDSMTNAAPAIPPPRQSIFAPARTVTPAPQGDDNIVSAKFRDFAALVERIPVWARLAAEWLSPRPLSHLLDRNILKASL
jgi:hypothetical protein